MQLVTMSARSLTRPTQLQLLHLNRDTLLNQSSTCNHFCNQSNALDKWTDINGFSRYQVSSCGNVRNRKTGKLLTINYERFKKQKLAAQITLKSDVGHNKGVLVSRLVLNCFDHTMNTHNLYAMHIDGDKYNNHLSNLHWRDKVYIHKPKCGVAVKLRSVSSGNCLTFESINACWKHVATLNINKTIKQYATISRWCYQKKVMYGYQFQFWDQAKYLTTVADLCGEQWKLYHVTPYQKIESYISSFGRSKRRSQNGKEVLDKIYFLNGYCYLGKKGISTKLLSRIVASWFVDNPNHYNMVDHIDADTQNNHASNLRWVKDAKQNINNPISKQRFSEAKQCKRKVEQLSLDGLSLKIWDRPTHIQKSLGYQSGNILRACHGKTKTSYGYKWRFCETTI
eukprot:516539_1